MNNFLKVTIVTAYGILPHQVPLFKLSEFKNDSFRVFETQDEAMWMHQ
jgi:hypothetical protein